VSVVFYIDKWYYSLQDSPHDPDGVCLVWNTRFKKSTPEYIFHCQSPVLSCCFARFHPNLILGGTYSGKIVLWDNRSPKRTPVQRSPLSAMAHTVKHFYLSDFCNIQLKFNFFLQHPVYCLSVVGTQNSHSLISISTDGKMCSWSLDMLAQPQETLDLQQRQSRAVAATCMAFPQPQSDINNFIVGSEEGTIYSGILLKEFAACCRSNTTFNLNSWSSWTTCWYYRYIRGTSRTNSWHGLSQLSRTYWFFAPFSHVLCWLDR
jgi:dynein intermediate chain